jgi:hypothetical protein
MNLKTLASWTAGVCLAVANTPGPVQAQVLSGGAPSWNAAMTRLFGDLKGFSAKAEMRVTDPAGRPSISVPMNFAMLDDKVRLDIDMTQLKGPQVQSDQVALLKQMAMDRVACIVMPDKRARHIIFPALAAYVEMPLPEDEVAALNHDFKLHKTPLGKETIDGHPCVKNRVVMGDAKGQTGEAVVWNATDLKEFPVQMQMNDKDGAVIVRYTEVHLGRPDAKQFVTPAGFIKHTDMQQLMMAVVQKQKGSQGGKK